MNNLTNSKINICILMLILFNINIATANVIINDSFDAGSSNIWAKTDTYNRFVIDRTTNNRLDISSLVGTETGERIYFDNVTSLASNWTYNFTIRLSSHIGQGTGISIGVSDTLNSPALVYWNDGVLFNLHVAGDQVTHLCVFTTINNGAITHNSTNPCNYLEANTYYGVIRKTGDIFNLTIYNELAHTSIFLTNQQTVSGITGLRYIYAVTNLGDNTGTATGYIDNLLLYDDLTPTPTATPTPTPSPSPSPSPTPASNRTYISNYNTTLTCISTTINNETTQLCTGQIAVVPYNQDIIIILLIMITIFVGILAIYNIYDRIVGD